MATPDELIALAPAVGSPNDEIILRAAKYLAQGSRNGLETAHNLLVDAANNERVAGRTPPYLLSAYAEDLRQDRIEGYGSVGRPHDMFAPYRQGGW